MQKQGTVICWDAARAFGFIRSPDTAADVFFHVRDYQGQGGAAPREGLAVVYEEIHVGGKGPRAMAVRPTAASAPPRAPAGASAARRGPFPKASTQPHAPARPPVSHRKPPPKAPPITAPAMPALLLMMGWGALLAWGAWTSRLPLWALGAVAVLNLLTFLVYAVDKSAARNGRWRTRESSLHLLSLAGGWPGAWFAQQWLRHKSRKAAFRAVYWATVLLHCAALAVWVGGGLAR
jgi:uncharacterized membrane protein YsdA (DUF1294 family)/cold shock CspA family protein